MKLELEYSLYFSEINGLYFELRFSSAHPVRIDIHTQCENIKKTCHSIAFGMKNVHHC